MVSLFTKGFLVGASAIAFAVVFSPQAAALANSSAGDSAALEQAQRTAPEDINDQGYDLYPQYGQTSQGQASKAEPHKIAKTTDKKSGATDTKASRHERSKAARHDSKAKERVASREPSPEPPKPAAKPEPVKEQRVLDFDPAPSPFGPAESIRH